MSFTEKTVTMTPELAQKYLDNNFKGNRHVNKLQVAKYAFDMSEGRWQSDACPPIIVSRDGTLLDGQHRLLAVINSGCAVEMSIREGVDEAVFSAIDMGSSRRASQMIDIKYARSAESIARIMFALQEDVPVRTALSGRINRNGVSLALQNSVILPFIEANQYILQQYVLLGSRIDSSIGRGGVTRYGKFAYFCDLLGRFQMFEEFADDIEALTPATRTAALCKTRIKDQYILTKKPTDEFVWGVMWQTFRAFCEGREISKVHDIPKVYKNLLDEIDVARQGAKS